jgi:hypothetical protein
MQKENHLVITCSISTCKPDIMISNYTGSLVQFSLMFLMKWHAFSNWMIMLESELYMITSSICYDVSDEMACSFKLDDHAGINIIQDDHADKQFIFIQNLENLRCTGCKPDIMY